MKKQVFVFSVLFLALISFNFKTDTTNKKNNIDKKS